MTPWLRTVDTGAQLELETTRRLVEDARRLLGEWGLFRGLGPDEKAALFARVRIHNFAVGESVFLKGSPGDNMMALLSGNIRFCIPARFSVKSPY
jgi:CRP-like cAMP-binding protein